MSYKALYRKYRPMIFEDVKGQDNIVRTLKNQIITNRIGHAYLFCGTRGTGKTSLAKLFAKTVNCENITDGKVCGVCNSCKSIATNSNMDVIEIDAASNNGVNNIRDIVEQVTFTPAQSKYKIFIIDEVHMLTGAAFNALLKTLEEPPSYVIFILATTEPDRIPITILSRCQRYDFKRITNEVIENRIQEIVNVENIDVEPRAVKFLSKMGDGSMRDALSLLEQCMVFKKNESITYDYVLDIIGAVDDSVFDELLANMVDRNVMGTIKIVEKVVGQGREISQFSSGFMWYLRNILLIKNTNREEDIVALEDVVDKNKEKIVELKLMVEDTPIEEIYRYIQVFSEMISQMRYSTQPRILLETTIIKLCKPQMEENLDSLVCRIKQLEEKIENGFCVSNVSNNINVNEVKENMISEAEAIEILRALPEEIKEIARNWRTLISEMPNPMKGFVVKAHIYVSSDNRLQMVFEDDFAYKYFENNTEKLIDYLNNKTQRSVDIEVKMCDGSSKEVEQVDLRDIIKFEIEIE